jgi:hypothetical protein
MFKRLHLALLPFALACGSSEPEHAPVAAGPDTGGEAPPAEVLAECPLFCAPREGSCKAPHYEQIPELSCGAYSMGRMPDAPLVDCPAHCCPRAGDGASGDTDADGFPNDADDCDDEPEQPDGYRDWDGCSADEQDNDGDGVTDVDDRCCYNAEDPDGVEDLDGCPEAT